jgi:hypothetical protein
MQTKSRITMCSATRRLAIAFVSLGMIALKAQASVVPFVGEDLQFTPNPTVRTNSDAAHAAFVTAADALGAVSTITFESAPLGSFTNLPVATGVTMNGLSYFGEPQTIRNTSDFPSYPSVGGSNTTPGGSQFVDMTGGTLVFTFAHPTQFFGAYLTGVQTNFYPDNISFNDGNNQTLFLGGIGTSSNVGETAFIGFTDAGRSITSVTITAGNSFEEDGIGVDDVDFQGSAAPEPSSMAMMCAVVGLATTWYAGASIKRKLAKLAMHPSGP